MHYREYNKKMFNGEIQVSIEIEHCSHVLKTWHT